MTKITYLCLALFLGIATQGHTLFHDQKVQKITDDIQRVRLDVRTPSGYTRHLLLGFTPDNVATDGVGYGYDALNVDNLQDDMNWIINNNRYVIQGVGAFDATKRYPLGLFLTNSGEVEIELTDLENFESPVDVYIYDAFNNMYAPINEVNFTEDILSGTYMDRFYLTFSDNDSNEVLSIEEVSLNTLSITQAKDSHQLIIKTNGAPIETIECFNILGQRCLSIDGKHKSYMKISLEGIPSTVLIIRIKHGNERTTKRILLSQL